MSLYLDTSVLVPLFVPESQSPMVLGWIQKQQGSIYLSDFAITEFHAVVSRLVRQDAIDMQLATAIREQFAKWALAATESAENIPADIRVAGHLVQTPLPKLLSADATHLATCRRMALILATLDHGMQKIADREGVKWVAPR